MLTLDTLVIVLLALALVVFLGEPFLHPTVSALSSGEEDARTALTLQKATLYTAIHDLDFDFRTGKVDQQDYEELRSQLEKEAATVLRQLDQETLHSSSMPASQGQCPHCSIPLQGGENYCPSCGSLLLSSKEA